MQQSLQQTMKLHMEYFSSASDLSPILLWKATYFPESEFRGFIRASVDNIGEILCTHLQTDSGPVYFGLPIVDPLLFSSYAEHQYNEILRLFDFVTSSRFPILIGDFNHGPAGPGNLTWLLPFNYGAMVARGLTSPYVLMDGRCTFCTFQCRCVYT